MPNRLTLFSVLIAPSPLPPPDLQWWMGDVLDRGEVRENMHMIILGDQRVQSFLVHEAFMI